MTLLRLAPLLLVACTGGKTDDTGTAPADTDTDTDTDTDVEPAAVWSEYRVGTSSTLNGVYASGEGVYVAGTAAGAFTGGAGDTWTPLSTGVDDEEDFTDLWGQGAGATLDLVVSATSGNVARYVGGAWTVEDLGTSNHEGVGGSGPEALYVVSWGGIFAYDGATWTFEAPPSDERLNDVWGIGADAFAVGEGGVIVRRSAGVWSAMSSGTDLDLSAVSGTSLSDVWAVGADGVALHFDGTSWTVSETGVDDALWAVFAPASNAVYAVGSAGAAVLWDGTAWTSLPTGVDNNLYAIHGANSTNVWAVGNRGIALQYKAAE
ncbi:MAG: hypothetical protein Q8P41_06115 [Pseudomonadota bacterium]|nr:hypothetical protein [Pseudomonadota bacterium]